MTSWTTGNEYPEEPNTTEHFPFKSKCFSSLFIVHQYLYSCIKIFICLTPSHWIEVNECMSYDRSGRILKNSICLCLFLWLISHLVHLLASEPIGSTLLALLICFPTVIVILDFGMFEKNSFTVNIILCIQATKFEIFKVAEQCFDFCLVLLLLSKWHNILN